MKLRRIVRKLLFAGAKVPANASLGHRFANVDIMDGSILSGNNKIGQHTYIGYNCIITEATIGRYCSIANNVSVGVGEHKIARVSTSSLFYDRPFETLTEGKCIIGNDVWLGSNAVIRRGVTIGDGAIVGANSFVNRDVKPFEIVGGIPARHIRMRFEPQQIQAIQLSGWWEKDLDEAKQAIAVLEASGQFAKDGTP